ncbi:MAG TPA: hypothetical protein VJL57_03455 [Candidatus Paceibacterota bacterium]
MNQGFSTLEIMIAFVLLSIVFAGVAAAEYGTQYWIIALETSGEGLALADRQLDEARMAAAQDFQSASSTDFAATSACGDTRLCYWRERAVSDISQCAKRLDVSVAWQTTRFPTSTVSLSDFLVDFSELIARGADCGTVFSIGSWTSIAERSPPVALQGAPAGIDAFAGAAYIVENNPSRLEIIANGQAYEYIFPDDATLYAIDVARDTSTGRAYAYIAATSSQLRIIDVTEKSAPTLVASTTLFGVPAGYEAGWRLQYYDGLLYIVTRFMSRPSARELHIVDVSNTASPAEIGSYKLSTSAYAVLVRDQHIGDAIRRLAYFATTHSSRELLVIDVTDPQNMVSAVSCDLPETQRGTSLFMLGNTLYLGRENVPSGGEDLYTFDASDPTSSDFCTSAAGVDVNDDSFSRHVQAIRGSGDYLFVATNNTTNAHGNIQIRATDKTENLAVTTSFDLDALAENGIDFDADTGLLYAVTGGSSPLLHVVTSDE